jgi:hypothetical protein
LVGVEALKPVSLEELLDKFAGRVSKLPFEFRAIFLEDLEIAVEHRLIVLESAT